MPSVLILPVAAKSRNLESRIPADNGDGSMGHPGFMGSQPRPFANALRVGPHRAAGDIDIRASATQQRIAHKAAHGPSLESRGIQYRKKRKGILRKFDPQICAQIHHHLIEGSSTP